MDTLIIDTANSPILPGCTSCSLSQSALGASTLSLEFTGDGISCPLANEQPVSLMHGGAVLFHGRVTSIGFSNDGGVRRWQVEVSDYWYLFAHQPAAAQLAEIKQQLQAGDSSLRDSLRNMTQSWADLARNVQMPTTGGWLCYEKGSSAPGIIRLDVSQARYSLTPTIARDRIYSTSEILQMMSECNPDCLLLSGFNGTIRVVSVKSLSPLELSLNQLTSAQLEPNTAELPSGVCVCLAIKDPDTGKGPMYYRTYPANVSLSSTGLRVFASTITYGGTLSQKSRTKLLDHLYSQAASWFEAVREPHLNGSITTSMSLFPTAYDSPLGKALTIVGQDKPDTWGLTSPITGVQWDFASRTVELTVGKDMAEPMLHEIEPEEPEEITLPTESSAGPNPPGPGDTRSESASQSESVSFSHTLTQSQTQSQSQSRSLSQSQSQSHSQSLSRSLSKSQSRSISLSKSQSKSKSASKSASLSKSDSKSVSLSKSTSVSKPPACNCAVNWLKAEAKINELISTVNRHSDYFTESFLPHIEPVDFTDNPSPSPVYFQLPDLD